MGASDPNRANSISDIIGVKSLRLGGLHEIVYYNSSTSVNYFKTFFFASNCNLFILLNKMFIINRHISYLVKRFIKKL